MSMLNKLRAKAAALADEFIGVIANTTEMRANVQQQVRAFLGHPDHGRLIMARMARSEVKNYLAELAEEANMPFRSPGAFLGEVKGFMTMSPEEFTALQHARREPK